MSSTSRAAGLVPAYHPSGRIPVEVGTIITAYGSNIFKHSAVKVGTSGGIELAAAGDRFVGTFLGVSYTDSNGKRQMVPNWTASTAGTDIVCHYTADPDIVYEIESDAAVALNDVGEQFDVNASSGSTTTGLSSQTLDVASTAANAGLRLIGKQDGPDNAWGDTYVICRVKISEHQYVADVAAI